MSAFTAQPILAKGKTLDIEVELDISVSHCNFEVKTSGDKITITRKKGSLSSYRKLCQLLVKTAPTTLQEINDTLKYHGITLYLHKSFLPVLGKKANPILKTLAYWYHT